MNWFGRLAIGYMLFMLPLIAHMNIEPTAYTDAQGNAVVGGFLGAMVLFVIFGGKEK